MDSSNTRMEREPSSKPGLPLLPFAIVVPLAIYIAVRLLLLS